MAKSKELKTKKADFAKGGTTKMFGKQHAGPQAPGITSTKSGAGGKFAKGGTTPMAKFTKTRTAPAGSTAAR
jgi:hypothetical protein